MKMMVARRKWYLSYNSSSIRSLGGHEKSENEGAAFFDHHFFWKNPTSAAVLNAVCLIAVLKVKTKFQFFLKLSHFLWSTLRPIVKFKCSIYRLKLNLRSTTVSWSRSQVSWLCQIVTIWYHSVLKLCRNFVSKIYTIQKRNDIKFWLWHIILYMLLCMISSHRSHNYPNCICTIYSDCSWMLNN